jgi:ABC-type amino acid transport system permease subunit
MIALSSFIVVSGLGLGFAYGWVSHVSSLEMVISIIVGGFFGTCLVAVLFTCHYFFAGETDQDKMDRPRQEIARLKKETSK